MAVALVGLVVGRLASVVEQQARDEINLVVGVKKEVENLSRKLSIIRRVLDDAERRKLKEKDVQGWIIDLENLSYDMDDMLDEWNTALMKMQQEGMDSAENTSSSKFSPCFCFKRLVVRRDIAVKIKELNSRLEIVNRDKDQFRFLESGQVDDQESFRPVKSTSFVKESEVYGQGLDREVVLRMLLRVLVIRECSNFVSLPPLGKLPLLESLELIALYDLKHVGREFLGLGDVTLQDAVVTFPKLQKFIVFYCFDWIDWEDLSEEEDVAVTVMRRLQHLELKGCSKLRSLPPRLLRKASSLGSLSILYCDELEKTLARSTKSVDSKELIDQILRGTP